MARTINPRSVSGACQSVYISASLIDRIGNRADDRDMGFQPGIHVCTQVNRKTSFSQLPGDAPKPRADPAIQLADRGGLEPARYDPVADDFPQSLPACPRETQQNSLPGRLHPQYDRARRRCWSSILRPEYLDCPARWARPIPAGFSGPAQSPARKTAREKAVRAYRRRPLPVSRCFHPPAGSRFRGFLSTAFREPGSSHDSRPAAAGLRKHCPTHLRR